MKTEENDWWLEQTIITVYKFWWQPIKKIFRCLAEAFLDEVRAGHNNLIDFPDL